MSKPNRGSSDPWDDGWIPGQETSKSQTSGVVVLESNDQVRKLFAPDKLQSSNGDDSAPLRPLGPMKYEVQTNAQGSQYRPQLRILKRTPAATPTSPSDADERPRETEAERMERNRRDKEAKYRAVRESIFGAESRNHMGTNNAINSSINSRSGSSQSSRNRDRESKDRTPGDSGRRAAPNSSGRSSNGSTPSPAREGKSGSNSPGPAGQGGIIRVPRAPDGTPGFGRGRVPARKGQ
ncbi:uncharacterized protein V1513DRAFT_477295 [Lipomyces chichibuensis]|uniref:uncharacterized protein n=1 Tax=Lipomyces chichibuensis TaxID=1546026 RepID=UPI0033438B49